MFVWFKVKLSVSLDSEAGVGIIWGFIRRNWQYLLVADLAVTVTMSLSKMPAYRSVLLQGFLAGMIRQKFLVYLFGAVLLVLLSFGFNYGAKSLDRRWLEWSPWGARLSITRLPMESKYMWLPYSILLLIFMPFVVVVEETIFRAGRHDWASGILIGSLAFGLLHLVFAFVRVRMALFMCIFGAIMVKLYMISGLGTVIWLHATYNLVVLTVLVFNAKLMPSLLKLTTRTGP
jgi:hypothetical protein